MIFYTLKVVGITKETEDTITLCFKQPGLKKVKYLAGQYLTLVFRINGRRYIRPYSFSSAPGIDPLLEVTIKRVPGGVVSNHINDVVKIDDSIEAMPAMGDFFYTEEDFVDVDKIVLWGAGSGITPLMSIAKYILGTTPSKKVFLVYGNRNQEAVIFYDKILELQNKYPLFKAIHFHTRLTIDEQQPYLVQGRIDPKKVLSILGDENLSSALHYICGPYGLKESVRNTLISVGVSADKIKSEDFELVKDPKDFESIQTQSIRLKFAKQDYILEVIKGKSILESALDAGIELPYSCQTGNCSTCSGKLIHGAAKMIGLTKEREDLLSGEYLTCCTHPLSDDVYIEIA